MAIGVRTIGGNAGGAPTFPWHSEMVTPSDVTLFPEAVAIQVDAVGTIVVSPFGRSADRTITITSAMISNGPYILRFGVRAVKATGTSLTSANIEAIW